MARAINTRWKIIGTMKAETPIHLGGMGGDADTDLALAVNGRGNYYIPGTSLAGALRGWMGRSHDDTIINSLWGFQKQEEGHASFIIIDDAQVTLPHNMTIEIREGVGIDRYTGAAADKAKYSRAILPKGVTFPLNITLDCQTADNPDNFWQLLRALEEGDIRIGAAKTRGLGKVSLSISSIKKQIFDRKNIFDVLINSGQEYQWDKLKPQQYNSPNLLNLAISWQPKDPVMVKAEGDGIAVDILPLVSQVTGKVYFVIPGSSIKGVLRSHAERIVRTVCDLPTPATPDSFLEQVKVKLVNELFGVPETSNTGQSQGKIGVLFVDDCYATIPMTAENWSAVENATRMAVAELKPLVNAAINKQENRYKTLQPAMHVAVDRWTGGAADGMLYSVLEPIGVDWEPIAISLDLEQLKKYGEENIQPAIALLFLVLRDFADGKIPIGYGTNRGMGTVGVTEITLNCSPIDGLDGIDRVSEIAADFSKLDNQLLDSLTKAWQEWINPDKEVV